MTEPKKTFDVLAVNTMTRKVRIFGRSETESNAEAIVTMAVTRRGVDEEYYVTAEPGKYAEGDVYRD